MAKSTGIVLAAGGIVAANELIFAPVAAASAKGAGAAATTFATSFNWRLIPATAILALTLGGLEKVSEPLGVGLAALSLLAVLIVPFGNAPTPLQNAAAFIVPK